MSEEVKKEYNNEVDTEETIDEMREESLMQLETMREDGNAENDEILNDSKKKLNDIFEDFKEWSKTNTDPDKLKEHYNKLKKDVENIFSTTKEKVIEVSNSENFIKALDGGKEFIVGAGGLVADGLKAGADLLMSNKNIKKAVDRTSDYVSESEGLKKTVDAAEELTTKLNQTIFGGLRKMFKSDEENEDE